MLFTSIQYLVFLTAVVVLYYQLPPRQRPRLLLVFSWIFYATYNPWFLLLLAASTGFAYVMGLKIEAAATAAAKRRWVSLSVAVNLAVLGFYKYPNFLLGNTQALAGLFGFAIPEIVVKIVLPLGISFYTFEAISYTVDVYRKELPAVRSLVDFAVFLSFFPHLVAGPIIRAPELLAQLRGHTRAAAQDRKRGIALFIYGVLIKVFIADVLSVFVQEVYSAPGRYSSTQLVMATYAFAVQIYCDFSGYSDMAIGSALLFGIKLPDNFHRPYLSLSLRDFWNRWHITLSRWLRSYLYIPLGGNRKGALRTHLNLIITMLLGGLWHGAGWNWVVWGGMQGGVMSLERLTGLDESPRHRVWRLLRWFVTFHITCLSWIFFRAKSCSEAWQILTRMGTGAPGAMGDQSRLYFYTIAGLGLAFTCDLLDLRRHWQELCITQWPRLRWAMYTALLLLILTFSAAEHPEFIYFAF